MRTILTLLLTWLLICNFNHSIANDELQLSTIDQYLDTEEAKYSDLVSGAQRSVRWFNGVQQTDLSIIYLHGFSASGKEISPAIEQLANELNANLYYARLTGHGRSESAMLDGNVEAWLNDTRQAYEIGSLIGKQVIVVSTSTGGTLATWLASQTFSEQLLTSIMISPNYAIKSKIAGIIRWPWGLRFAKWLRGPYYSFEPMNILHEQIWTERYPIEAVLPMFELLELVGELDKSVIQLPQLVIFSPDDHVVSAKKIEKTIKEFINSEVAVKRYQNSTDPYQHVLAGDACSPESTTEVVGLMSSYVKFLLD